MFFLMHKKRLCGSSFARAHHFCPLCLFFDWSAEASFLLHLHASIYRKHTSKTVSWRDQARGSSVIVINVSLSAHYHNALLSPILSRVFFSFLFFFPKPPNSWWFRKHFSFNVHFVSTPPNDKHPEIQRALASSIGMAGAHKGGGALLCCDGCFSRVTSGRLFLRTKRAEPGDAHNVSLRSEAPLSSLRLGSIFCGV